MLELLRIFLPTLSGLFRKRHDLLLENQLLPAYLDSYPNSEFVAIFHRLATVVTSPNVALEKSGPALAWGE